ncbi:MAG: helix-turn-helix domain-containing protein, partial [Anaerovoracaceae bacterium]
MLTNKDFGIKIAELRKKKGLTQTQLAEMLNISNKTVSRWETGEGYPEITLLSPLAKALGVTTDELLAEHEEGTSQGGDENFDIPCSDNCG